MQNVEAWLKLATTDGVSVSVRNKLLDLSDNDPERALWDTDLIDSPDLQRWRRQSQSNDVSVELAWLDDEDNHLVCRGSNAYPPLLQHINDPPLALFVRGQLAVFSKPAIAMVGARRASQPGCDRAARFAREIARAEMCVVSGLARGIDANCHRGALEVAQIDESATTIAVMASGADVIYPRQHQELSSLIAQHGALVTEYRCGSPPLGWRFPHRNRIVSGLAAVTVVIEATIKSGSLITARLAAEQGRDVVALPGPPEAPNSQGCHELIRSGAGLVESAQQLLDDLGIGTSCHVEQSPDETKMSSESRILTQIEHGQTIFDCIGYEPVDLDFIVLKSRLTIDRVCSILSRFELEGLIQVVDGGRYCRASSR